VTPLVRMAEEQAHALRQTVGSPAPPAGPAMDLARAAATGDPQATRRLLELVAPRVVRAARAVMGAHHPEFEDAVQLTLIALIHALPSFRGECAPDRFAARIAVRTAGAVRRRARTRSTREDGSIDPDGFLADGEDPNAARRRRTLRALLDDLPEEQAEALAMRIALGWSLKDIADTTGVPLNTVRSRIRLAKEGLRRRIADDPSLADELDAMEGLP
jgi:RNA polymerase sigma-70 factor (ECF subfamily)